jgi:hypothetical protein
MSSANQDSLRRLTARFVRLAVEILGHEREPHGIEAMAARSGVVPDVSV